jgi:hypothetical protein
MHIETSFKELLSQREITLKELEQHFFDPNEQGFASFLQLEKITDEHHVLFSFGTNRFVLIPEIKAFISTLIFRTFEIKPQYDNYPISTRLEEIPEMEFIQNAQGASFTIPFRVNETDYTQIFKLGTQYFVRLANIIKEREQN